jgi:hypothetical protein
MSLGNGSSAGDEYVTETQLRQHRIMTDRHVEELRADMRSVRELIETHAEHSRARHEDVTQRFDEMAGFFRHLFDKISAKKPAKKVKRK